MSRFLWWPLLLLATPVTGQTRYDPTVVGQGNVTTVDLTFHDATRNRELPVLVYLPAASGPAPMVLFSHGLGGARTGSAFLGQHWAARGYLAVFLQHPGSDESVWKGLRPGQVMRAMQKAANAENLIDRIDDVGAVLDQVLKWNRTAGHPLSGRIDPARIGMSGHSFGALTTQGVSGQVLPGKRNSTDRRIRSAIMFSPSSPRRGDPADAFGKVAIPWLLMTGTRDVSPIGQSDTTSRLAVFPGLPAGGGHFELVLWDAEHSVFTDRPLPGDKEQRNPNHHPAILAISTAFLDATLRQDAAARAWLNGAGPRSVLEPKDRWQGK